MNIFTWAYMCFISSVLYVVYIVLYVHVFCVSYILCVMDVSVYVCCVGEVAGKL